MIFSPIIITMIPTTESGRIDFHYDAIWGLNYKSGILFAYFYLEKRDNFSLTNFFYEHGYLSFRCHSPFAQSSPGYGTWACAFPIFSPSNYSSCVKNQLSETEEIWRKHLPELKKGIWWLRRDEVNSIIMWAVSRDLPTLYNLSVNACCFLGVVVLMKLSFSFFCLTTSFLVLDLPFLLCPWFYPSIIFNSSLDLF